MNAATETKTQGKPSRYWHGIASTPYVVDVDTFAKLLDVPTPEVATDDAAAGCEGNGKVDEDGYAEHDTDCECGAAFSRYMGALEVVAEQVFGEHGLILVPRKRGGWTVHPKTTWADAANLIRDTINGVGMFEFRSLRDFLESGPYTARAAVLSHLHWMKRRSDVYGDPSPKYRIERRLRY